LANGDLGTWRPLDRKKTSRVLKIPFVKGARGDRRVQGRGAQVRAEREAKVWGITNRCLLLTS